MRYMEWVTPFFPGISLFVFFCASFTLGAISIKVKILGWDRHDKWAIAACILFIVGNAVALLVP